VAEWYQLLPELFNPRLTAGLDILERPAEPLLPALPEIRFVDVVELVVDILDDQPDQRRIQ